VKKIKATVTTKNQISNKDLQAFQPDNLKEFSEEAEQKLRRSIIKFGMFVPLFIWGEKILDGHHRLKVLKNMQAEGYEIEKVPVVEIQAKDEAEAVKKVLIINSRYAHFNQQALEEWMDKFELLESDVYELIDIEGIELEAIEEFEPEENETRLDEKKQVECPKCNEIFTPQ